MAALQSFLTGETPIPSAKLNAIIAALNGSGNTPVAHLVNDPIAFALTLRNADPGGRGLIVYAADGVTELLRVDTSGVKASVAGAAATPVVDAAGIQTLTNKTLDSANNTLTIRNAALAADVARANLLTNGGFKVSQRGAGPFTTNGAYTFDRWLLGINGASTCSLTRQSASIAAGGDGGDCAQLAVTVAGGAQVNLSQTLKVSDNPSLAALRGKSVALSARVFCNQANAAQLYLSTDGTAPLGVASTQHPGDSTWRTLTATGVVPTDATQITVFAANLATNGTYTVAVQNAMLVPGTVPADFVPLHPADDLARCLRYYEVLGGTASGGPQIAASANGVHTIGNWIAFKATKAVAPTITKNGTWALTNCGQPSVGRSDVTGFSMQVVASAAGAVVCNPDSTDDVFIVEANP